MASENQRCVHLSKSNLSKPGRENWVPDASVSNCKDCNAGFGFFTRKHHCRACGFVFCDRCAKYRIGVHRPHYSAGEEREERVCSSCFTRNCQMQRGGQEAKTYPGICEQQAPADSETNSGRTSIPSSMTVSGSSGDANESVMAGAAASTPALSPPTRLQHASLAEAFAITEALATTQDSSSTSLCGPIWDALCISQPTLADTIQHCADLTSRGNSRFENESEAVFQALRRGIRACPRQRAPDHESNSCVVLEELPGKFHVWCFLEIIASRQPFYKRQAQEVSSILQTSAPWAQARRAIMSKGC